MKLHNFNIGLLMWKEDDFFFKRPFRSIPEAKVYLKAINEFAKVRVFLEGHKI